MEKETPLSELIDIDGVMKNLGLPKQKAGAVAKKLFGLKVIKHRSKPKDIPVDNYIGHYDRNTNEIHIVANKAQFNPI